jgi:hypothetical protein
MVRFAKSGLTPGFVRCRSHKPSARSPNEVLSERQRVRNRSELRLLAYPQPDCSQRLTTWKKNGRCVVPARVRGANRYSLRFLTRWRSLKPCARHGEQSILREALQGRSDKMWSESTFATEWSPGPPLWPQCSASRWPRLLGKIKGRARSSFPVAGGRGRPVAGGAVRAGAVEMHVSARLSVPISRYPLDASNNY